MRFGRTGRTHRRNQRHAPDSFLVWFAALVARELVFSAGPLRWMLSNRAAQAMRDKMFDAGISARTKLKTWNQPVSAQVTHFTAKWISYMVASFP